MTQDGQAGKVIVWPNDVFDETKTDPSLELAQVRVEADYWQAEAKRLRQLLRQVYERVLSGEISLVFPNGETVTMIRAETRHPEEVTTRPHPDVRPWEGGDMAVGKPAANGHG